VKENLNKLDGNRQKKKKKFGELSTEMTPDCGG